MHPLFADTDWSTVVTASVAAFLTVLSTIGAGIAWLLNWRSKQEDKEREYSKDMMARFENLVNRVETIGDGYEKSVREISKEFQSTANTLAKEARDESRGIMTTLLQIQGEAVDAVTGLANEVRQLANLGPEVRKLSEAVNKLQIDLEKKVDKDDHNKPSGRPRSGG